MFFSAIISAVGVHGVASFQVSNWLSMHIFFATLYFGGSLVMALCTLISDYTNPDFGNTFCRFIRKAVGLATLIMLLALCLVIFFHIIGAGDCSDSVCLHWQFVNAILEICVFTCLMSFYVSFIPEFKGWHVSLTIEKLDDKFSGGDALEETLLNGVLDA